MNYEMPTMPADHAVWVIEQIEDEAKLHGAPLAQGEIDLLSTSLHDMDEGMRPAAFQLNNRVVPLIRSRIERQKLVPGVRKIKVRRGLTLPIEWNEAYLNIHGSELPWLVSGVLQNAFLNNAWVGERKLWKSR